MSVPVFIAVYADGTIAWHQSAGFAPVVGNPTYTAAALLGVFKINTNAKGQKLTTLTGTAGTNLALSNPAVANGRNGVELT